MDISTYATHSPFSDPGVHADVLAHIATDHKSLHDAVTGTILHYRADKVPATPRQLTDIDLRWISNILDVAVQRGNGALDPARDPADRVGGCCRDHSLLSVAILRQQGIAARTRVGFADYFTPGFHHDHVVVEQWEPKAGRWRRFDPELDPADYDFDVSDMPTGPQSPFVTCSEAWREYREGRIDPSTYGVDPTLPDLTGPSFIQGYVGTELAHRMKHETLLWDVRDDGFDTTELTDRIADLVVRADDGDTDAENALVALWHDGGMPPVTVRTWSPTGKEGVTDLETRVTTWQ